MTETRVQVFLGKGGVGKTTCSAATSPPSRSLAVAQIIVEMLDDMADIGGHLMFVIVGAHEADDMPVLFAQRDPLLPGQLRCHLFVPIGGIDEIPFGIGFQNMTRVIGDHGLPPLQKNLRCFTPRLQQLPAEAGRIFPPAHLAIQVTRHRVVRVVHRQGEDTDEILAIIVTSKLSGTYNVACKA